MNPDQTAPRGAVVPGSILFAILTENISRWEEKMTKIVTGWLSVKGDSNTETKLIRKACPY